MNVFEASQERLKVIFENFDNVYVSFSGGKDSGLLLNITLDYARKINRRIGVFHIDYEAQYKDTTDYVQEMLNINSDIIDRYHICLPIAAQCATSMHQSYWIPWDKEKKDIWVRDLPPSCINEENNPFDFFKKGMWDYDLQNRFCEWIHSYKKAKKTCCLVGIRTQESLNRWRAIYSDSHYKTYKGYNWTKEMGRNIFNAYPIFDWKSTDVWIANANKNYSYNKLYDLFWKAGLDIDQMRVASPFNDCAKESLKLYRVIDQRNWGKMIGRVDGVNFTGIYGGTTAMGWKSIKLPNGHTWKSYMEFLLTTLPKETAQNYKKKLEVSIKFWKEKGGCLSRSVVRKLKKAGVNVLMGNKTKRMTSKKPVRFEYLDDIDIAEFQQVPSYKRMCVCILKNDHTCKYMGFAPTKTEVELRHRAMTKYKGI